MKKIPVGKKFALVDDEDFENLSKYTWSLNTYGYAYFGTRQEGKRIVTLMHRLILMGQFSKDKKFTDHQDGNRLNNQKSNIRVCTPGENARNSRISIRNTSGYKGVHWLKKRRRWRSHIKVNNKSLYVGTFKDVKEAARAYNNKAKEFFGDFAFLNKV